MTEDKYLKTPLIQALEAYCQEEKVSMHMPGHKGGNGFPHWLKERLSGYDATEIPGLDNLHRPESVILDSQMACARAFGAIQSYFLVNGSTSGIQAMILSAFRRGDTVLVARNCHRSVINAFILFGLRPVFVMPRFNEEWHCMMPVTLSDWREALKEHPDARGVMVTSPDYFGVCSPLDRLAQMLHESGKLLLVDEAHGAHFAFSEELPVTALEQGADLCVQSLHKTMPALTQTALLHIGSDRVDRERVQQAVSMLTTTSPSYMLMASMDYARCYCQNEGKTRYHKLIELLAEMKEALSVMKNLRVLPDCLDGIKRDPTRIVLDSSHSDISGQRGYQRLSHCFGLMPEMADEHHVVFIVTLADSRREINRLKEGLLELEQHTRPVKPKTVCQWFGTRPAFIAEVPFFPDKTISLPLEEAVGQVSAQMVTPYPPGIPVLCPGEWITQKHIEFLRQAIQTGVDIQGLPVQNENRVIRVIG